MIDVKTLEQEAKDEINKEAAEQAKEKLKYLYKTREKAALALKNIDKQIAEYLKEIEENVVYESAGVDTTK